MEVEKWLVVERTDIPIGKNYVGLLRRMNADDEKKSSIHFWIRMLMGKQLNAENHA
jgi:hypothetical protein